VERKDVTDLPNFHVERINQAHQRLDAVDSRLKSVETHVAVATERAKNMQDTLGEIKGALSDIKGTITWVTRLIIGGIIMGAVAFALAGGFNVP